MMAQTEIGSVGRADTVQVFMVGGYGLRDPKRAGSPPVEMWGRLRLKCTSKALSYLVSEIERLGTCSTWLTAFRGRLTLLRSLLSTERGGGCDGQRAPDREHYARTALALPPHGDLDPNGPNRAQARPPDEMQQHAPWLRGARNDVVW